MIKSETELYFPINDYFTKLGFKVDAEVKDCDIVAIKDNTVVICELKRGFTIELIYQLVQRKKLTPYVYAVIPRPKNLRSKSFTKKLDILKALDCGLMVVLNSTKRVDIILEPRGEDTSKNKLMRKGVEKEAAIRKTKLNLGGQSKRKIVTAHKESLIATICYIEKYGEINTRKCKDNIKNILQRNHYGYFIRLRNGVYTVNEEGLKVLNDPDYKDIADYYRKEVELCLK
ncbi:MAG: DUF2161 family putative PD-(D/E)XK-type phosphodiesterase [Lachnospirales bacterium]